MQKICCFIKKLLILICLNGACFFAWLLNGFINCSFNEMMFQKFKTVLEKRSKPS